MSLLRLSYARILLATLSGISITSTALTFEYSGVQINLLDTPGHQDFSEDTYRTLAAADNAVMLVDGAKGIEPQTRKLFEVARMRQLPIFTVVNKMDRPALNGFEIIEQVGVKSCNFATCSFSCFFGKAYVHTSSQSIIAVGEAVQSSSLPGQLAHWLRGPLLWSVPSALQQGLYLPHALHPPEYDLIQNVQGDPLRLHFQVVLYERKGLAGRSKAATKREYDLDDPELKGLCECIYVKHAVHKY